MQTRPSRPECSGDDAAGELAAYQDVVSRIRFVAFGTERDDADALSRVQALIRELDQRTGRAES
jgi:hypothetical protein